MLFLLTGKLDIYIFKGMMSPFNFRDHRTLQFFVRFHLLSRWFEWLFFVRHHQRRKTSPATHLTLAIVILTCREFVGVKRVRIPATTNTLIPFPLPFHRVLAPLNQILRRHPAFHGILLQLLAKKLIEFPALYKRCSPRLV